MDHKMDQIEEEYHKAAHEFHAASRALNEAKERYRTAELHFHEIEREFKLHTEAVKLENEIAWSRKIRNPDFQDKQQLSVDFSAIIAYTYETLMEKQMFQITYTIKDADGFLVDRSVKFHELKSAFAFMRTIPRTGVGALVGKPMVERV